MNEDNRLSIEFVKKSRKEQLERQIEESIRILRVENKIIPPVKMSQRKLTKEQLQEINERIRQKLYYYGRNRYLSFSGNPKEPEFELSTNFQTLGLVVTFGLNSRWYINSLKETSKDTYKELKELATNIMCIAAPMENVIINLQSSGVGKFINRGEFFNFLEKDESGSDDKYRDIIDKRFRQIMYDFFCNYEFDGENKA